MVACPECGRPDDVQIRAHEDAGRFTASCEACGTEWALDGIR